MKNLMYCRRTFLSVLAILCLTALGYTKDMDVALSIAGIVAAVAGSNAYEKKVPPSDTLSSK